MTQLNDTIRAVFLAHGFTIKDGHTDLKPYVYEAAHALLSKLRAPVADERQALAHVANEWADMACNAMVWIRNIQECISTPEEALANLKANLTHCREVSACASVPTALASAPVAGEAVAHAVISYGRIQRLVVNEESAHEYAEQQRLNAEAAGWDAKAHVRPLVYGDAAPQASEAVRILFPTHLRKMWSGGEVQAWLDEHQGVIAPKPSAKGSLERYRKWQAEQASQAVRLDDVKGIAREVAADSAEIRAEARGAALEEAAAVAKRISDKYAFGYYGNEVDTADEIEREILALKPATALSAQPGAQKNGGSDAG